MTDYLDNIDNYLHKLFPICRSLTGMGNRETLQVLQEIAPLKILEYPSNTRVYDWVVPREWGIRDGYIKNSRGETIVDFRQNNLHVMGYSQPIRKQMVWEDLEPHLYCLQDLPEAIPYRTTYYKEDWGFCLTCPQYESLENDRGPFEVVIDSSFKNGSLTIGELLIKGEKPQEVLISTYICHPSLANDNLSGMVLTAFLAKELLSRKKLNRSYRIIFVPETIGAIAYCAMNEKAMRKIVAGLVVATVGGPGSLGYKQSFNKDHYINRLIEEVFIEEEHDFVTYPFDIHGSDERQYSSPGFRINTAAICKDKYYEYPGYHNSFDNLDFVKAEYIHQSLGIYLKLIDKIEKQDSLYDEKLKNTEYQSGSQKNYFLNRNPNCEVMLSRHGLYPDIGGDLLPGENNRSQLDMILWLLFFCDGSRAIEEISRYINVPLNELNMAASLLEEKGLLSRVSCPQP